MTSSTLPIGSGPGRLSYARARLYLGISGVGTAVLAAVCVLYFDIAAAGFAASAERSLGRQLFALGLWFAMVAALFFLFDLMGGAWVVRRKAYAQFWLARWIRGVALHWLAWMLTAVALMLTARAAGDLATIGVFAAIQLLLALFRGPLARVIARFDVHAPTPALVAAAERAGLEPQRLVVLDAGDESFVGGWSSLFPRTLYVPLRWTTLPANAMAAALARRAAVAKSGAHLRGVLGAIVWNVLGFVVTLQLTGASPATAEGIVTLSAGLTLWAFLGVLLLPTPSRAAVYAADESAARTVGREAMIEAAELLDRWQDDEEQRAPAVEGIFHPVPSRGNRLAMLRREGARPLGALHAHHLARHALWLGWGAMSPISRVVHCNVGRTALWAMLPGD